LGIVIGVEKKNVKREKSRGKSQEGKVKRKGGYKEGFKERQEDEKSKAGKTREVKRPIGGDQRHCAATKLTKGKNQHMIKVERQKSPSVKLGRMEGGEESKK
jgi:hypothetical protein